MRGPDISAATLVNMRLLDLLDVAFLQGRRREFMYYLLYFKLKEFINFCSEEQIVKVKYCKLGTVNVFFDGILSRRANNLS